MLILGNCKKNNIIKGVKSYWGRSSAGRAPALQAGGQEFDSPRLHQVVVVSRARKIPALASKGQWFDVLVFTNLISSKRAYSSAG